MKKSLAKRLLSAALAAVVLSCAVPSMAAEEESLLAPRASVAVEDGYIVGLTGPVSADFIKSQFAGEVTVTSAKGEVLEGDAAVGSDSAVGDIARIIIPADLTRDGKVNLGDVSAIFKSAAKWDVDMCTAAGDLNGDLKVNLADASVIMKYIAGWGVSLAQPLSVRLFGDTVYTLVAGELGAAVAEEIKNVTGFDIPLGSAEEGERSVYLGMGLEREFDFIDAEAAAAVPEGDAYVDVYGGDVYITFDESGMETAVLCAAYLNDAAVVPGYTGEASDIVYAGAAARVAAETLDHSAGDYINRHVLTALEYAEFTAPKNIILMIGDGMGQNIIDATEAVYADSLYNGTAAMNYLPGRADQSTYSANSPVTDSAAGGTALATGHKTTNGAIAMYEGRVLKNLGEVAAEQGKAVGVIATHRVTDATPAVFTSHVTSRDQERTIASQQLSMMMDGDLDLLIGGGRSYFETSVNIEKIEKAKAAVGLTYVNNMRNWDDALSASPDAPLLALLDTGDIDMMTEGMPSLAEQTELALSRLSRDRDGFFMMVEGSSIDSYAHGNNFAHEAYDCYDFDCAVAVAMRYVAMNPDTVLVVTADHETGSLSIPAEPTSENIHEGYSYGSGDHSAIDVPLLSVGYGTEMFTGRINENVDVAIFLASLMSDEEFGMASELCPLADMKDPDTAAAVIEAGAGNVEVSEGGVTVSFTPDAVYMSLTEEDFITPAADIKNCRAIHVTMTNKGESPIIPPTLVLWQDNADYYGEGQIEWLMPGETKTVTYVMQNEVWWDGYFGGTEELILSYADGEEALLEVSDITATQRGLSE